MGGICMSCYVRHLEDLLVECGLENTKVNRKLLDEAIKKTLGACDLHCPEVWEKVKEVRDTPSFRAAVAKAVQDSV
jgi:hypothetical protein